MKTLNEINMPALKPVRISTHGLSFWKKVVKYFERRKWEVVEDYKLYVPDLDNVLLVPKGFIFDAASIPRILWPLINPTGISLIPSLFHDMSYEFNCLLDGNKQKVYIKEKNRREFFDILFRDLGIYINGFNFIPNVAFKALRLFGYLAWNRHRKLNKKIEDCFNLAEVNFK